MRHDDAGGSESLDATPRFSPTIYLYDNYPGGVGLSEPLWTRQAELVRRALDLIDGCDCAVGCPACVGPVLVSDEGESAREDATFKTHARRALRALSTTNDAASAAESLVH